MTRNELVDEIERLEQSLFAARRKLARMDEDVYREFQKDRDRWLKERRDYPFGPTYGLQQPSSLPQSTPLFDLRNTAGDMVPLTCKSFGMN